MSRVGRRPIPLPQGVTVTLRDATIAVKGPKGALERVLPEGVDVKVEGAVVQVARRGDEPKQRARHGLVRALVNNMVTGVTKGFERALEVNGVGYRAEVAGQKLTLALGYSHPIVYDLPKGITGKVDKNRIVLSGIDVELLGETAATIKRFRKPDPYKAKGVKYADEVIKTKVGKTGAS